MSFPITCTACHKTFTISDEIFEKKVAGRVVTIKCKSCSAGIRVDGTKGGGSVAPPAPAAPTAAAATAAPAAEPLWAVDYPDGQDREFTTAEVIVELERGVVSGTTLVWREGMGEWLEVHQVPELAGELTQIENKKKAAAVAAAKAAAAAAGPVHKPRAPMPTVTGLAGLPGAVGARLKQPSSSDVATPLPKPRAQQPSTPELPKPRAQQPSTPELPKPRAQQASSPVLPKPAPPAPFAAPAPAPPPPPAPLAAPTPLPTPPAAFVAPSAPRLPAEPLFDATPPLPASVAKVVSRPPQPQPAFPSSGSPLVALGNGPALVADHASVEWPEAKKKTPLIIVGVIAAVAVIGGAIVLLGGKDEAPPPAAPISALPPTPAAAPTSTPAATPAATPTTPQTGADTAAGSDPVATAPDRGATPGAGFAELFAAGARKAESKGATVAPTARFDAAATKVPLAQAASDAQACKQSGGPTGKVTVAVTFDPNGKVSSATISEEPFAGTPTGTCISAALKRASIAPFSGLPGTVSKTFSIL
jgi:GYF domain 2